MVHIRIDTNKLFLTDLCYTFIGKQCYTQLIGNMVVIDVSRQTFNIDSRAKYFERIFKYD